MSGRNEAAEVQQQCGNMRARRGEYNHALAARPKRDASACWMTDNKDDGRREWTLPVDSNRQWAGSENRPTASSWLLKPNDHQHGQQAPLRGTVQSAQRASPSSLHRSPLSAPTTSIATWLTMPNPNTSPSEPSARRAIDSLSEPACDGLGDRHLL